ncbi:MAG TPA: DUF4349 domain-containing protein [Microbacterium sp.]|nr:DUF4349 domain-containing protein [Microbacterium sp.]
MSTRDTSTDAGAQPLPELSDERIEELERTLFAGIAREREVAQERERRERRERQKRMRRRRAVWWTTAAAAVVIVGAAAIGPTLGVLTMAGGGADTAVSPADGGPESAPLPEGVVGGAEDSATGTVATEADAVAAEREIITTAQATVRVDDVAAAARSIGAAAEQHGGYVESMNIGEDGVVGSDGISSEIRPYPVSGAWITVRVPADQLTGAIDELTGYGTVVSSSINRQDVTEQTIDLRARIDALSASVDRLTELMGKAGSVGDLIAAESALSQRQAELESYQQQLTSLEKMVSLSSLTVSLTPEIEPVKADPAGFGDGLTSGWNGLVATLNGLVVALGFLLPWLAVAAVVAVIVWVIVWARRRARRAARAEDDAAVGGGE